MPNEADENISSPHTPLPDYDYSSVVRRKNKIQRQSWRGLEEQSSPWHPVWTRVACNKPRPDLCACVMAGSEFTAADRSLAWIHVRCDFPKHRFSRFDVLGVDSMVRRPKGPYKSFGLGNFGGKSVFAKSIVPPAVIVYDPLQQGFCLFSNRVSTVFSGKSATDTPWTVPVDVIFSITPSVTRGGRPFRRTLNTVFNSSI